MSDTFFSEDFVDPDAAPKHKTETGLPSVYDNMRADLTKPIDLPKDVTIPVKGRAGFAVKFDVDIPLEKLHRWQKASRKKPNDPTSELNTLFFHQTVIQETCLALVYKGEDVFNKQDERVTFKDDGFQDQFGAMDARAAIKSFYARDPYILSVSADILVAAGYAQDDTSGFRDGDDPEDPLD